MTVDSVSLNLSVTDCIFIFVKLSLLGYFTKHFDTSEFGQDGGILIYMWERKWEHLEVRFSQSQISQDWKLIFTDSKFSILSTILYCLFQLVWDLIISNM